MAVQVWIGEKPEHPNERRAVVALAHGLERLDGLHLILANFSVGGRAIDLVVIKQDAIFVIELKHCDGRVIGDVNGPWWVESANGYRKRINPGRKNPYNQVISYYYSLINFLNDRRGDFLSPNRAANIDFRSCRRAIVIAPRLEEGSQVDVDWKVDVRGLDELPAYLVTERSAEISLSDDEMLAIPELLNCTRWNEVNALIAGVMPGWDTTPTDIPDGLSAPEPVAPAASEPVALPAAEPVDTTTPSFWMRVRRALHTWPGRAAVSFALLSLVLLLALLARPTTQARPADQALAAIVSTSEPGLAAGGLDPLEQGEQSCIQSPRQPIGRRQGTNPGEWQNVGVLGTAPGLSPDLIVTLNEVSYCGDQIKITWSVRNKTETATFRVPLTADNVEVRDTSTIYTLDEKRSQPLEMIVGPGDKRQGSVIIDRPLNPNAITLRVTLRQEPFGEAIWMVPVGN